MSVTAILLLAFGLADIASARPRAQERPLLVAVGIAAFSIIAAYVLGLDTWQPWVLGLIAVGPIVTLWLIAKSPLAGGPEQLKDPRAQLTLVLATLALALILSNQLPAVGAPFATWFANLPLPGAHHANATQVALAIGAAAFMLHTTNRIIRLVLEVVGGNVQAGANKLKGGRYIGPLERVIVAALMLAGSLEGAGLIILAKGFIRLPEIRSETQKEQGVGDAVAEYFLIGTLTSIVIAAALAALILAAG